MRDILVLCYHAVSKDWPADLAVTPGSLDDQLRYLLGRGYRATTFTEALSRPAAGRTLSVTFDDGFQSVLELAFPILQRLGVPATIFVPTAFVGATSGLSWPGIAQWEDGRHARELSPVSWEDLDELAAAGWEIGSHTHTHPRLTRLDDGQLARELEHSKEECERRLGGRCSSIAYPFGDVDARVASAARDAGYRAGASLSDGRRVSRPLDWPRFAVSRQDSLGRFRRQVSPAVRRLRASPAGPFADRAYAWLLSARQNLRR